MKSKNEIRKFRPSRWWSNVQALRVDADVSEVALSKLLGRNDNYINLAVKNGGSPNVADAIAIAEAFDTTIEELAFGNVGLELRKKQLESELQRIIEELEDAKKGIE